MASNHALERDRQVAGAPSPAPQGERYVPNTKLTKLPAKDIELLKGATNSKVVGFTFCGMKDCNEIISHKNGKHAEATWGVIFHLENMSDIGFTWGENSKIGDPFHIHIIPAKDLTEIDSLETQEASKSPPWRQYVGKYITKTIVHYYQTNYSNLESWYNVPWGIEFEFNGSCKMLVSALHHGAFTEYLLCADEVVIIFDDDLINEVIQSHSNFKSEWEST